MRTCAWGGRGLLAAAVLGVGLGASAQMHKVRDPEKVVRAVGVYEWTGDLSHPTASRFIPVSLFIDGELQDAAVYLARPVPFALDPGTEYELDAAGLARGDLALESTAHAQTPDDAYTDGWIGYGSYRPPAEVVAKAGTPGKGRPARVSGTMEVADTNGAKPKFASRSGDATSPDAPKQAGSGVGSVDPTTDADRPTMKRRTDPGQQTVPADPAPVASGQAGTGAPANAPTQATTPPPATGSSPGGATPASRTPPADQSDTGTTSDDDGKRPTMRRRDASGSGDPQAGSGSATTTDAGASADDPADRPTLKRRTPAQAEDAKKEKKRKSPTASVTGVGSLNDDPDRPTLHRGAAGGADGADRDVPKLMGTPPDLRQMVAVSDAARREAHPFARPWESDAERAAVMGTMRSLAAAQVATYVKKSSATDKGSPAQKSSGAATPASSVTSTSRRPAAGTTLAARKAAAAARSTPAPAALEDEDLRGFLICYVCATT